MRKDKHGGTGEASLFRCRSIVNRRLALEYLSQNSDLAASRWSGAKNNTTGTGLMEVRMPWFIRLRGRPARSESSA